MFSFKKKIKETINPPIIIELNKVYWLTYKDPFKKPTKVIPTEIKNGYVQYSYLDYDNNILNALPSSMDIETYYKVYKLCPNQTYHIR